MDENTFKWCDQCKEVYEIEVNAVMHCDECNENYCENCCNHHQKRKKTASHTLLRIRNKISESSTELAHAADRELSVPNDQTPRTDEQPVVEETGAGDAARSADDDDETGQVPEVGLALRPPDVDDVDFKIPSYRVVLELACHCSIAIEAEHFRTRWMCSKCDSLLQYAFDDYFYCKCGRGLGAKFQFQCVRQDHGEAFTTFPKDYITHMVSRIKRKQEVNILILGETGVGKSTWINSIMNYMTFPSLEKAKTHEKLLALIGGSYIMSEIGTNYKMRETIYREDDNENNEIGQSSTQFPKTYVFELETRLVRLIDTPGIGDTRGTGADAKNFDNILKFLANLDYLNGICILMKSNNTKLNVYFRFCIQELLTHLHKDALKNIVFCFTNSRSAFYTPGESLPALNSLLEKNVNIEDMARILNENTIFCMDNEAFKYLCAVRDGVAFSELQTKSFSSSWDISVAETNRMIDIIAALPPHAIKQTLSLNDTRRLIVGLTRPLADIAQNIQTNIAVQEDKKREIKNLADSDADFEKVLYFQDIDLVKKDLGFPRTVCTASRCVKHHAIPNSNHSTTEYVTICHDHCMLRGVSTDICPNTDLQRCAAMESLSITTCTKCKCSWDTHMHITYEYEQKPVQRKNEVIEEAMQSNASRLWMKNEVLAELNQLTKKLEMEQVAITDASVKFACHLKTYAIAPYNDAMADYLEMLIKQEERKVDKGGGTEILEGMKKMKESYYKEVHAFEEAKSGQDTVLLEPNEILELVQKLYKLELNGSKLKEIVETAEAGKQKMMAFNETVIRPEMTERQRTKKPGECVIAWLKKRPIFNSSYRTFPKSDWS